MKFVIRSCQQINMIEWNFFALFQMNITSKVKVTLNTLPKNIYGGTTMSTQSESTNICLTSPTNYLALS